MRKALAGLLLLPLALPAGVAVAQNPGTAPAPVTQPGSEVPGVVRWGKWGATLLFVGFTTAGVLQHHAADDDFADLRRYCLSTGPCTIGPDGRYTNPDAEARYRQVAQGDRSARAFFIAGQAALAGAAALFVIELTKEKGTRNIPYSGLTVGPSPGGLRIGWKLSFGSP